MHRTKLVSLLLALIVSLTGFAVAEDVYVKNKPFKGEVVGHGMDTELSLPDLAEALGLEAVSENGLWQLGEAVLPGRTIDGTVFVTLKDLKSAGFKVMHSPELGTIDISQGRKKVASSTTAPRRKPVANNTNQSWGSGPTLVYFGANW